MVVFSNYFLWRVNDAVDDNKKIGQRGRQTENAAMDGICVTKLTGHRANQDSLWVSREGTRAEIAARGAHSGLNIDLMQQNM